MSLEALYSYIFEARAHLFLVSERTGEALVSRDTETDWIYEGNRARETILGQPVLLCEFGIF